MTKKRSFIPFLADIQKVETKWEIFVIPDRCKGCKLCEAFCPRGILEEDLEFLNVKGYHPPQLKSGESTEHCAGCEFCQLICPEFAIFIQETRETPK
ncbi:MAG: 4Fe-4S binding protein [Candidatus Heimdallarchaeota archaeon]